MRSHSSAGERGVAIARRVWTRRRRTGLEVTCQRPRAGRIAAAGDSQRRLAFSAPANIVEGASRKGKNEFRHFLDIALGSLGELEYALEVAAALEYLRPEVYAPLQAQQQRARFFTWKLKKSMS